ncbi:hypothetical protein BFP70_19285 [Thioclava sp. SK-1]|uniref:DedA family protein n=1 Tax=Thioclava sp. SK-1 TaxID=1889770 RepID=UPI000826BD71|nr:VTT domain-containing protein [Thioclava sp. SK-1]OCX58197.1 hypothetical protein BFP70_19285 [Thioclava sp. SK-1]
MIGHATTIDAVVTQFGVVAVFIGCALEGEVVAMTAGVLARHHLLVLWQVVIAAGAGAISADLAIFLTARHMREHRLVLRIMAKPGPQKALSAVQRHPYALAYCCRFIPGMRIVGPLALAQSHIPTAHYIPIAVVTGAIWACLFTILGHVIGHIIARLVGDIHHAAPILLIGLGALCVLALYHHFGRKLHS